MIRSKDYFDQQYSVFPIALAVTWFIYLGLGFITMDGLSLPKWIWWSGLVLLGCGVLLQFVTHRVAFIRIYQASLIFTVGLTYGALLLKIVARGRMKEVSLLLAFIILLSLLMTMIGVYKKQSNKIPNSHIKPISSAWEDFNPETGVISRASTGRRLKKQRQYHQDYSRLNRIGPLIAGLSMLVVSSLNNSAIDVMIAMISFIIILSAAGTLAAILFQLIGILRWEKENGKQVVVKR